MNRRNCLQSLSALGLLPLISGWTPSDNAILKRAIPTSGEKIPAVGLGTWRTFDVDTSDAERAPRKDVLKTLVENGGAVVDSSPMYGRSERVVGDLSTELSVNDKLFIATKVWTSGVDAGISQMNNSFAFLKRKKIDLMQIHNLVDWETHIKTLRTWKEQGKIRYIGITHYTESAFDSIEQIIKTTPLDFVQIKYSVARRRAEERLFPLAQEKKIAVIINQPFEEGALFSRVKDKTLPVWAGEFDCKSWAQFFLKFILAQPAVTCVIPGTSNPHHMLDNIQAGLGKLPTESHRSRMISLIS
jgi:diketogulonate reductase-like aldo/keto reductase